MSDITAEEIDGFRQALIDEKAANQVLRAEVEWLRTLVDFMEETYPEFVAEARRALERK